jgi:HPt (histidine-containing phosphotransfer) domain-containing protein
MTRQAQEQALIDRYFEGDEPLYLEYAQACLVQFPLDVELGDAACARQDMPAIRHLAHALKTVLRTLGRRDLSEMASAIEDTAAMGKVSAVLEVWGTLRAALPRSLNDCALHL